MGGEEALHGGSSWAASEAVALEGHGGAVCTLSYSPDGMRLLTSSLDGTAKVWEAATGRRLATLRGHADQIRSAVFSPDGARIATASLDSTARVFEASTGRCLASMHGHTDARCPVRFSPDGRRLATACYDKTARILSSSSGQCLAILQGHTHSVSCIEFSPGADNSSSSSSGNDGGNLVVTGSWDSSARLWDAASGRCLVSLQAHINGITSVSFLCGGARVATTSWDCTSMLWDSASGQCLGVMQGHTDAVVAAKGFNQSEGNPSGSLLVTSSIDSTARVWDPTEPPGQCVAELLGHTMPVDVVALSPDGTLVATGSTDKTTRVWDAQSGRCLAVLRGHANAITSLDFSPVKQRPSSAALSGFSCSYRLATASRDGSVRIWRLEEVFAESLPSLAAPTTPSSSVPTTTRVSPFKVERASSLGNIKVQMPHHRAGVTAASGFRFHQQQVSASPRGAESTEIGRYPPAIGQEYVAVGETSTQQLHLQQQLETEVERLNQEIAMLRAEKAGAGIGLIGISCTDSGSAPQQDESATIFTGNGAGDSFNVYFPWELNNTDYLRRVLECVTIMLRPVYHAAVTKGGCAKARREDKSCGHVDLEAEDVDCCDVTVHMLGNKSHYAREDVLGMAEEDLAAIADWVRQARDMLLAAGKGGNAVTHSQVIEAINNAKHLAYAARVQFAQKNLAGLMRRFSEHTKSKTLRSMSSCSAAPMPTSISDLR